MECAPLDHEAVLDLDHLVRQTFADRDLEREVLALFDGQCERLLPVLAGSGPERERRDAAHTLKGAARAIGAGRVAGGAEALEGVLERGEEPGPALAGLAAAVAQARAAIAGRQAAP